LGDLRNLRIILQFSQGFNEVMDTTEVTKYLNTTEFNLVTSGNIDNIIDRDLLLKKFSFKGVEIEKNKEFFIQCLKDMTDEDIKLMTKAITGSTMIEYFNSNFMIKVTFIKGRNHQVYIHSCFNQIDIESCETVDKMKLLIISNLNEQDNFNVG
jgi:hypothetical protein